MINYFNDLIAKYQFWRAKRSCVHGEHFQLEIPSVDDDFNKNLRATILKGKYKGCVLEFSNFNITDAGMLSFETHVVSTPKEVDPSDRGLLKLSSNIARVILTESVEMAKHELRTLDSRASDEERTVYEESPTVPPTRVYKRKPRKKSVSANTEPHPEVQQPAKPKRTRTGTGRKPKSQ